MKTLIFLAAVLVIGTFKVLPQDWAKARLDKSPRHQEWVTVKQDGREVRCFIVYPEVKDKVTAVVLIHEIFGLSEWVRSVADQLAEAGYIAIAPDLLSGLGPNKRGTEDFSGRDALVKAVSSLPPEQVTADLNAVTAHVSKLPACNGKVTVAGFCWGGSQAFRFATNNKEIKAAFVFYGSGPDKESDIARIVCPVYGFYGGDDARVTSTVAKTTQMMKQAGKTYEPIIYEGAGHGFMRTGEEPSPKPVNKSSRNEAWKRWLDLLK